MVEITEQMGEAWEDYVDKAVTAQKTLKYEDGTKAALAWRRFIDLFADHENLRRAGI
ncbi:hypothetical protein ACFO1V_03045 [Daeguia caeni]|uniref:Uncharacterized protein n=1 Tax=Daeguia caeni TaxID=439612 RepID=A0ABV9H4Z8_9HYPH